MKRVVKVILNYYNTKIMYLEGVEKPMNFVKAITIFLLCCCSMSFAVTPEFAQAHREPLLPDKNLVFKKTLFVCGQINAAYLGINDLVAALQLAKTHKFKFVDASSLSAQLLAVKIGLVEKPALLRHIAREIEFCEQYPGFPLGFNDSPEGPEKMSAEFYKIADHIEKLPINYQAGDFAALKKEADRVVFDLFWTDGEKMRSLCMDMLNFIRVELKEDLPFDIFGKK